MTATHESSCGRHPGTAVYDSTKSLMQLIHRRTSAIRIARNAAVVIWYLLESSGNADGYAVCTKRRGAKDLHMSVSELRTALNTLLHWGWIERQSGGPTTSGHYRLTSGFLDVVRYEDEALYATIHEQLQMPVSEEYGSSRPETAKVSTIDADLRQVLHALSLAQWMHRLFELNRLRRDRYRHAYNKRTLRNICKVLHWFLQQDARHPDVPIVTSLRRLFEQTGLVFETAKRARDYLVAWGVLAHAVDVYRLRHQRLVDIIDGEDADLPAPTQRLHRRKPQDSVDSSRMPVGGTEASARKCFGLAEPGSP